MQRLSLSVIELHTSVFTGRPCSEPLGVCTRQPLPNLQAHIQDLSDGSDVWSGASFRPLLRLHKRQGMRKDALASLCLNIRVKWMARLTCGSLKVHCATFLQAVNKQKTVLDARNSSNFF